MAIAAATYGIAEYKPISIVSLTPADLMIDGSQKLTA